MKIIFEPKDKYISQIRLWLHEELLRKRNLFYYNFIKSELTKENFVCYVDEHDHALGFFQYTCYEKHTRIEVAVVKFDFQRNGIGRTLLEAVTNRVKQNGTVALSLMCEPKVSERRWKKLGFKNLKGIENHRFLNHNNFEHPWLYKIIVPYKKSTTSKKTNYFIELWTELEHNATSRNLPPTYKWDVNSFDLPIVHPVDVDWKIRLVKHNDILYEGKIKRFNYSFSDFGEFLIIENLLVK